MAKIRFVVQSADAVALAQLPGLRLVREDLID